MNERKEALMNIRHEEQTKEKYHLKEEEGRKKMKKNIINEIRNKK